MPAVLEATVIWIPRECGGRPTAPHVGLRPSIRFQKDVGAWLQLAWDVEITKIDSGEPVGTVELRFSKQASPDPDLTKTGEAIELLEAHRVIGVGTITRVEGIKG